MKYRGKKSFEHMPDISLRFEGLPDDLTEFFYPTRLHFVRVIMTAKWGWYEVDYPLPVSIPIFGYATMEQVRGLLWGHSADACLWYRPWVDTAYDRWSLEAAAKLRKIVRARYASQYRRHTVARFQTRLAVIYLLERQSRHHPLKASAPMYLNTYQQLVVQSTGKPRYVQKYRSCIDREPKVIRTPARITPVPLRLAQTSGSQPLPQQLRLL